jgi:hypothetical protein
MSKPKDDGLSPPWREQQPAEPDPNECYFAPGRDALERDAALCALQPELTEEEQLMVQKDVDEIAGELGLGSAYFGSLGGEPGVSQSELKKLRQEIERIKRRLR